MVAAKKLIMVLESVPVHSAAMHAALGPHGLTDVTNFFDNSPDAINWLSRNLMHCGVISLNHDLGPERIRDERMLDPGTGRDVANYLAERTPVCPVILHTDNFFIRPRMQSILDGGGWVQTYVSPGNGVHWVAKDWLPCVLRLLCPQSIDGWS